MYSHGSYGPLPFVALRSRLQYLELAGFAWRAGRHCRLHYRGATVSTPSQSSTASLLAFLHQGFSLPCSCILCLPVPACCCSGKPVRF